MNKAFAGQRFFITGGSRGIGLAIAKRLASEGAKITLAAKTTEPHPKLEGTIYSAAEEVRAVGGDVLPLEMDIRDEETIQKALRLSIERFSGLDGLILNASAIQLTDTPNTPAKRFDLMMGVIVRGSYLTVHHALPTLKKSASPRILALCPKLSYDPKWLSPHVPYSLAKFGLSMMVKGWAGEFAKDGIQVNGLWPRTLIATAAVKNLLGGPDMIKRSRRPEIVAEAASWILNQGAKISGEIFEDETCIRKMGLDPQTFAIDPKEKPQLDLYVEP